MNLVYALAAIAALFATCKGSPDPSAAGETIPLETAAADVDATSAAAANGEGGGDPDGGAFGPVSSEDLDGDAVQLRARDRREQAVNERELAVPPVRGGLDFARLKPKIRAHQLQLELEEGAR